MQQPSCVVWPVDVVSRTGRGWQALSEDEVVSDDGQHRLLRRDGHWAAFERPEGVLDDDAWVALTFTSPGTLAGVLDAFDGLLSS